MQLISKFNKRIRFLICAIDIYRKYAWVVPLTNKKTCSYCECISKNIRWFNGIALKKKTNKNGLIKVVNFTIDQWNHG